MSRLSFGKKQHPHEGLFKTLLVLNFLDMFITMYFVEAGLAEEMNPIMGYFLNHSLVSFAIFKIFAIQYVLMIELNRYYKKDKVSKKWMWYLLNAMYVTVLLWNITIVSLRALGISE